MGLLNFFGLEKKNDLEGIMQAFDTLFLITITNSTGDIIFANDKFCETSKFNRTELIGKNHRIHNSGFHSDQFFKDLWDSLISGKNWSGEIRNRAKDGSFYWAFTTIFPTFNHELNEPQYIAIRYNINDKKNLEKTLDDLKSNLDKAMIERDINVQFLATLGHDLKTPLTVAKFSAQIIENKNSLLSAEKVKSLSSKIVGSINRVDALISEILDNAHLNKRQDTSLEFINFDMHAITTEIIENFITIHGSQFRLVAIGNLSGYWCLSGVKRILENLITNAIKYGDPNSLITISITDKETFLELCVHNTGNPISKSDQLIIFNYLQRTSYAKMSGHSGWGLGLTIVKGLTELHGGKVSIESSYDLGTTFKVVLPKDCRR